MTRTTHRSPKGKKLYAVRDKAGRFKDVQTYKRAHSRDLRTKSAAERTVKGWAVIAGGADTPRYVYTVHDDALVSCAKVFGDRIVRCTITLHEPKRRKHA